MERTAEKHDLSKNSWESAYEDILKLHQEMAVLKDHKQFASPERVLSLIAKVQAQIESTMRKATLENKG